jgi:hypothetical protein
VVSEHIICLQIVGKGEGREGYSMILSSGIRAEFCLYISGEGDRGDLAQD